MADNDPQQELKKRARRRLVGALAMALAAAIILPMVMDGEPKQTGNDLQIKIPSQEGSNFTSRTIKAPVSPIVANSEPQAAQSKASAPSAMNSVTAGKEPVSASSRPDAVSLPAPESSKPKAVSQEASQKTTPSEVAIKKPDAKAREDARAHAILEDRPLATGRDEKVEVFYVQLGVYRDAANAKDVQAKAAGHGVKSSLEKLGANTRVRSGPFPDRASAEALVVKLKQAGLPGIVAVK